MQKAARVGLEIRCGARGRSIVWVFAPHAKLIGGICDTALE